MKLKDIILQYLEDDKEAMKHLVSLFFNAVMKEEAKMQVGADEYERSNSRKAHRNGYRTRSLKTRCVNTNQKVEKTSVKNKRFHHFNPFIIFAPTNCKVTKFILI